MQDRPVDEWRNGWPVVLAAIVGACAIRLHLMSLGPLIQPIEHDMGWSRQQVISGQTIASFVSMGLQPIVGVLLDKFGVRRVAITGLVMYGLSLAYLSQTGPSLTTWILGWLLVAISFSSLLTVWVTGITGQFRTSRGTAIAVGALGVALATAATPIITTLLAKHFGWRTTYLCLAAFPLLVALPVVAVSFKDLRPLRAHREIGDRSIATVLWSRHFWQITFAAMLITGASAGLVIHLVPILVSMGASREAAAAQMAWIAIGGIVGPLAAGFLLDRLNGRLIAVAFVMFAASGVLMLVNGSSKPISLSFDIIVIGVAMAAEGTCIPFLASKYFGVKRFAFAFAAINSGSVVGAGVAPLVGGMLYDRFHTYWHFELAVAVGFALAAVILAALGPYPLNNASGERVAETSQNSIEH